MELLAQLMEGEMNGSAFQAPLKHPHTATRESAYGALMIVRAAELIYVRVGIGWIPFFGIVQTLQGYVTPGHRESNDARDTLSSLNSVGFKRYHCFGGLTARLHFSHL